MVARCAILAATEIFTEMPLIVALPDATQDLVAAVACRLLELVEWRLDRAGCHPSGDFEDACELQSATGPRRGTAEWATSVAKG